MTAPEAVAPSPFIPGTYTQWAWDSTALGYFKACPRLYYYRMIEGWRQKEESVHLIFGQIYHTAIEHHIKNTFAGMSYDDSLLAVVREAMISSWPWPYADSMKSREILIRSIIWYIENFRSNGATTVKLENGKPAVELSFRFDTGVPVEGTDQTYILSGHLDQVVELAGEILVIDHKTSKYAINNTFFEKFSPDIQMSLYSLAAQIVYQIPAKGVVIDGAQLLVGGTRFERGVTYRTPGQLNEFLEDTIWWMKQQKVHADASYWPMNEKSCGNYGGCPFRMICSKDPSSRPAFLESNFEKTTPWNPLAVR